MEVFKLLNEDFFDGADMDGISAQRLQGLWEMFGGQKYKLKYYLTRHEIAPTWGSEEMNDRKKSEEVYKEALESGKTWQEITGYKEPPEKDLL